jgi:hypothetical protein
MRRSRRTATLDGVALLAFAVAITPNTIEAFADPGGAAWATLRVVVSTIFVVALAATVLSRWLDRRA